MAAFYKMATALLVLISVILAQAHRERSTSSDDDDGGSSNELSSSSERLEKEIARRSEFQRPPRRGGQLWQYEGLAIDVPARRGEEDTTSTSTTPAPTTTPIYPPLNPRSRRIYNPDESTSVEEFPFIAALLVNNQLWCGAVIIARDRVLTAAHCLQLQFNNRFYREYVKMLTVRVGSSNATAGGSLYQVSELVFHPNYNPSTLRFNAAILKLQTNITGDKAAVIEYSREERVLSDRNITFLGWGSVLGFGSGGQVLLQKLQMPIYDLADCQEVYGRDLVTRNNFCAGYITLAKSVCNHDAGGPATLDGRLVGLLSFSSKRCDEPDQPAVFTAAGALATWLDKTV